MKIVKDINYILYDLRQNGKGYFNWKPHILNSDNGTWIVWWLNYRLTKKITTREI